MMQAFYWDVPVDAENLNGLWWGNLKEKGEEMARAGITAVWTPPPAKGAWSIYDMGYGVYDHYDLGNYKQRGNIAGVPSSKETRFGSIRELINMVNEFQTHGIEVYTDIVLNHMYGGTYEYNPVVTGYVNGERLPAYPAFQMKWVRDDIQPGDYYLQLKGYNINRYVREERAFELHVTWKDEDDCDEYNRDVRIAESNRGNGHYIEHPGSGCVVYGHAGAEGTVDEFRISVEKPSKLVVRIYPRYDDNGVFRWRSGDNGFRVVTLRHNDRNLPMDVHTPTSFKYVGKDTVPDLTWNYSHFNPSDNEDYLEDEGFEDEVRPNWMIYGVDLNTKKQEVRQRLVDWGVWLTNTVGFDGYRLDFVRGLEQNFVAEWLNAMPERDGNRRFSVAEYWSYHPYRIREWVDEIESYGAESAVFDFPLRDHLSRMCNDDDFNMASLNKAGMIRNDHHSLSSEKVVTFLENHDTGKEHDNWIQRDWDMGYAFILFADGTPCIYYPHYYHIEQVDMVNREYTIKSDGGLRETIDELIRIRRTYLKGGMEVLTQTGAPHPVERTEHLFVARREGSDSKAGGILVLNNHQTDTLGVTVSTEIPGWESLAGRILTEVTGNGNTDLEVQSDGRVKLFAPPRGYSIYVIK